LNAEFIEPQIRRSEKNLRICGFFFYTQLLLRVKKARKAAKAQFILLI